MTLLRDPKVSGLEHSRKLIPDIVNRYRDYLILFLVDGDGRDRSSLFRNLGSAASAQGVNLICCAAKEEVEVWLLAGHVAKLRRKWRDVRADVSVKENVFAPFLQKYGDSRRPGGGRDLLMKQTLSNFQGLLTRCPELAELRDRICRALAA